MKQKKGHILAEGGQKRVLFFPLQKTYQQSNLYDFFCNVIMIMYASY